MSQDITADFAADTLRAPMPLRYRVSTRVGAKTDLGRVRENNEDKFEYYLPADEDTLARKGQIFLVCDGMGGHNAGQIASELAIKTFLDTYLNHPAEDPSVAARAAGEAANRYVFEVGQAIPSRRGMGTTLTALILWQDQALWAQVGDSRGYRLRTGDLTQRTPEHTWIEESVAAGMLTREQAESHPYRHVITRAIGTEKDVLVDTVIEPFESGDIYVLCSDGLTNHVTDPQILATITEFGPSEAAWKLVGQALLGGGSDNCTVLVIQVDSLTPNETSTAP